VTLRGLGFRGTRLVTNTPNEAYSTNVDIHGVYGNIIIEDSEFLPSGQLVAYAMPGPGQSRLTYNGGITAKYATGGTVTVRNNVFTGGDNGITSTAESRIAGNVFRRQSNAAVALGPPGAGIVEDNDIAECGVEWCVSAFKANTVRLLRNHIRVDMARPTSRAVVVAATHGEIRGNTFEGIGGSRLLADPATFPITSAAIAVETSMRDAIPSSPIIADNTISGAYAAFSFAAQADVFPSSLSADVTNNGASSIGTAFIGQGVLGAVSLKMNRNDFSTYGAAADPDKRGVSFNVVDLRCNWWGQSSGPAGFYPAQWASAITPWATQPIAGRPSVACP
jgi:hypothetical protein